jgi:CheY-like chemotaxis protein
MVYDIVSFEDNESNIKYLEIIIRKLGYSHINFIFPQKGIDYVMNNHKTIKLILMDIMLPEIDGNEVIKIIKAVYPEIPIIVQTALISSEDRYDSFAAGCDGFITKPINKNRLSSMIKSFVK